MKTHIDCACLVCGHKWKSTPTNLLGGRGCSLCANKNTHDLQRKTTSKFITEMLVVNTDIDVCGEYVGAKIPIACRCKICGCEWTPTPTNLLSGQGCPGCGRKRIRTTQLKSHEQFVLDLHRINPGVELLSTYNGSHNNVTLRCKTCGETWECMASNAISHPMGCPTCTASHGEKAIAAHLRQLGINYQPQHRFDGLIGVGGTLLSYDFFLPDYNVLIEYQGEYHDGTVVWQTTEQFASQKEHDARKRAYAESHNYRLIEIWYWDFTRIGDILNQELNL